MDIPGKNEYQFWNENFENSPGENEIKKGEKKIENKFIEFGKLGGRPSLKELKKTERINLFFTKNEMNILQDKADSVNMKLNDFCRKILNEKELPNKEENLLLNQYILNFKRISNFMKAGIWNEEEKKRLENEILDIIKLLKNNLTWE